MHDLYKGRRTLVFMQIRDHLEHPRQPKLYSRRPAGARGLEGLREENQDGGFT